MKWNNIQCSGGVGWAIENFRRQNFFDPTSQAAKTFWTPPQHAKKLLTPPHCWVYNISFFPGQQ